MHGCLRHAVTGFAVALLAAAVGLLVLATVVLAHPPQPGAFETTWARTDKPVHDGIVQRTWMWGPEANTETRMEPYDEAPNGMRTVQYFDKSRMEITNPDAVDDGIWYVTNGLLVTELITGRMQIGATRFEARSPAWINVAGDPDSVNGPTYATFTHLLNAPPLADGAPVIQQINRSGTVTSDPSLAAYGITTAYHVQVPGVDHQIAAPFWAFMNAVGTVWKNGQAIITPLFVNPFYATGYPITEAYWTNVAVGGGDTRVLVQCFQRRCLTYTPTNPPNWQVEAGNVGQHYYAWRYSISTPGATATASVTATTTTVPTTPVPACDPAYPDFCIAPPPPDLDCDEVPYGKFTVLPPDPHGFDPDKDGEGCESGASGPGAPQATHTATATRIAQPTKTATPTKTPTATKTPKPTRTPTPTATQIPAPTVTPTQLPPSTATPPAGYPNPQDGVCISAQEVAMLDLINTYRIDNGLPPFTVSAKLNRAAWGYSWDAGNRQGTFPPDHATIEPIPDWLGGPTPLDRAATMGYAATQVLETTGAGFSSADAMLDAWVAGGAPYTSTLLAPDVTQIGIGYVYAPGGAYQDFWTVDLAAGEHDGGPPLSCP